MARRVLYVITGLGVGGAERSLCELVRRIDRERFEPTVAHLMADADLAPELAAAGVEVHHLGMSARVDSEGRSPGLAGRTREFLRALKLLEKLLDSWKPDLLHAYLFHASMLARMAVQGKRPPIVISSVRVAEPRSHHMLIDRLSARWNDWWVCVSEGVKAHVIAKGIPGERVSVIANGVDASRFRRAALPGAETSGDPFLQRIDDDGAEPMRMEQRKQLGVETGHRLLLSVGRLERQKGVDVLLRAFARSEWAKGGHSLLLVGDGPLRGELESLADASGLGDRVKFAGGVEDTRPLMLAADAFALASRWEGMPNALLEAMAMELPAVATRVSGSEDLVDDGVTGWLVPPDDVGALADALDRFLSDQTEGMGRAARERVRRSFTIERMVEQHEGFYERLLGEDAQ